MKGVSIRLDIMIKVVNLHSSMTVKVGMINTNRPWDRGTHQVIRMEDGLRLLTMGLVIVATQVSHHTDTASRTIPISQDSQHPTPDQVRQDTFMTDKVRYIGLPSTDLLRGQVLEVSEGLRGREGAPLGVPRTEEVQEGHKTEGEQGSRGPEDACLVDKCLTQGLRVLIG